ncbi:hypothetical protein ES319_A13G254600v1 [Gossypium barbadense]|uniref:Uncharacterized protein n=1 Tax=Gossypium barbadense TaxID=3634 RepID=A0A5J5T7Y8_GOSBA|nr:hypothetical protein ES319_A13G254600v1 [Gossypium barbadense]KAB2050560.1 hypothetical protein ES319_A13G254600v1 [Gossypium barbadense]
MVSDASEKKAAQKKADNGVDNIADGDSALQISDRTCTGDLCSHPVSRDIRIAPPPAIPNQAPNRTDLAHIADSLEDEYYIGFTRHRPCCHRRYTVLRSNELFNRLYVLYFDHFRATYLSFKSTIEAFDVPAEAPQGTTQLQYAVACYISSFFWDLYVSIRKSVNKLSHTALLRYYSVERNYSQDRHDPFLHHLLSVIKPTHLFGSLEDVLFIPLICNNVNFDNAANPFSIARFIMNEALVQGLLDCMDAKNSKWRTVPLPHETLGRPFWLLDWRLNQAYAWFPQEGHFSKEDLIAAQILGIPCTPRLGPCDVDDWQFFAGNALPAQLNVANYERATPRRFYGAAEYRTIAHRQWLLPQAIIEGCAHAGSKRPQPEPSSSSGGTGHMEITPAVEPQQQQQQQPTTPPRLISFYQYQLTDWCYHGLVVFRLSEQKQNEAFRSFLFTGSDAMACLD